MLAVLARSRTAPAHYVERSAIILHLADRRSASETATAGIDRQRVTRCARRVAAVGPLEAINDLPRSGRPPDITEAARAWLIGEACAKAKERGYPHELWTLRLLAAHARCHGPIAGHTCLAQLAPSTVHDILNNQPIKPHKVRYYLDRRDPAFDERKAEVIEVYAAAEMVRALLETERPVAILSYDEKPGIQAIATTAPDSPPKPGKHPTVQRDHEYKRLGTVTLSAAATPSLSATAIEASGWSSGTNFQQIFNENQRESIDKARRPNQRFAVNALVGAVCGKAAPTAL
jgi:hypothetical protein